MSDDPGTVPVRIGASGMWVGIASAVVLLIAAGGLVWFGGFSQLYGIGTAAAAAVVTVHTLITRRRDGVTREDPGLVVTVRGQRTVHRWSGLLEVGWAGQGFPYTGAGLLLRPVAGGPWDTPGPNTPTQVATLAVFGRAGQRHARTVLAAQCTRHDVPFAANGRRMLDDGPPGSHYRTDAPRRPADR